MLNNCQKWNAGKIISIVVLVALCIPTTYVHGQGDDLFIDGALEYYRQSVIQTQDNVTFGQFYFMGFTNSYTTTLEMFGVDHVGKNNGIRYEVVSRYVFEHPEKREETPQTIMDLALGEKWPQLFSQTSSLRMKIRDAKL